MGRSRRKRRKTTTNITIMCITAITALNVCGISYASWQDGLNIDTKISTGIMKPIFVENTVRGCNLAESNENEYLKVETKKGEIFIKGRVRSGYSGEVAIEIDNDGNVPFVLDDINPHEGKNDIARLVKVGDGTGEVNLEINAIFKGEQEQSEKQESEDYKFGYKLIFEQRN